MAFLLLAAPNTPARYVDPSIISRAARQMRSGAVPAFDMLQRQPASCTIISAARIANIMVGH